MSDVNIEPELEEVFPRDDDTANETPRNRKNRVGKNAARERSRVQQLKTAFNNLQRSLPNVPEDTKLSRLDILLLAINHIQHLESLLSSSVDELEVNDKSKQGQQNYGNKV